METSRSPWVSLQRNQNEDDLLALKSEKTLRKMEKEALAARQRAEQRAALIIKEAELAASEHLETAKVVGFEKGLQSGLEQGLKEAEALLEEAREVLKAAKNLYAERAREVEPELLALVLEVATRVIGESLAHDPELILDMLWQNIRAIDGVDVFSLRVNPKLVAFIEGGKEGFFHQFGARITRVIGDTSISSGAVIETSSGIIDATVETQIENIAKAIGEARNRSRGRIL